MLVKLKKWLACVLCATGPIYFAHGNTTIFEQLGSDIDGEATGDFSGGSVSISADGSTVAIGATRNDGNGTNSGHVRIYQWSGGIWQQLGADIDGEAAEDFSGRSISISADGSTVAIGADYNDGNGTNSGHVRIYQWSGGIWQQLGADIDGEATGDFSGGSVSISADGSTVAIGATGNDGNGTNSGHVRIYQWSGGIWQQLGADIDGEAAEDFSGRSISISADGSTVAIGADYNDGNGSYSGHVRIYQWSGGIWQQLGSDIDGEAAYDNSGASVSISADGSTVAIGADWNNGNGSYSGSVRIYQWSGGIWQKLGSDIDGEAASDRSGNSVSISADGSTVAIGADNNNGGGTSSGHVRVYQWNGGIWQQLGADIDGEAAEDFSGASVSISADGSTVAIGADWNNGNGSNSGHVRVYSITLEPVIPFIDVDGFLEQLGQDINGEAAGDFSSRSISISADGSTVAIGATRNDAVGDYSGHVRVYQWNAGIWQQLGSDIDGEAAGDYSGASVSISADGATVAIGATSNDGNGTYSGHVRIYQWSGGIWQQLGADIDGEAAGDFSGASVSISADGATVAIGATGNDGNGDSAGHTRIYRWNASFWQQLGADIDGEAAFDYSGRSISISADGSTVAIGATRNGSDSGHVQIYQWSGGTWQQLGADIIGKAYDDRSGKCVSISADGATVAIGADYNDGNGSDSGHVRIYQWSGGTWQQLGADIDGEAAGDFSGRDVSISADGATVAIGATGNDGNGDSAGHTRIYRWNASFWQQLGADIDGEAAFDYSGDAVSISADGSTVAIGAFYNDGNGSDSGHVRVYSITTIEPVIPVIDVDGFHETSSGQNVTVDATPATGNPASFTYQWYFKDFAIPSMFGGTTASYTIEGTTENDGTWRVVVTNSVGSTEASFEYRVFSDADSDGLSDYRESNITNTNPDIADTDLDGLSDFIEVNNTLTDPNNADSDNDGLLDGAEVNSHASDPLDTDSDDDGLLDGAEVNTHNTSPIDTDSDDDSLSDGAEVNTHGTNPNLNDSDTDGLSDFNEIFTNFTDPSIADSDGDGLTDGAEINTYSSNPLLTDSSGDGLSDDFVVSAGFSPSVEYTPLMSGWQSKLEDARAGSVMLEVANGSVVLKLQIERSDDLSTWTNNTDDLITVPIDMTGDNQFFRFAMPQE